MSARKPAPCASREDASAFVAELTGASEDAGPCAGHLRANTHHASGAGERSGALSDCLPQPWLVLFRLVVNDRNYHRVADALSGDILVSVCQNPPNGETGPHLSSLR